MIEQGAKAYAAAYNAKDLKAMVGFWSPEGVYIDRASGRRVSGRDALEKDFQAELESRRNSRLEIAVETIELVSPGVAIEQGKSTITSPDAEPIVTSYVKRDGEWLIDRVSEREIVVPPITSNCWNAGFLDVVADTCR